MRTEKGFTIRSLPLYVIDTRFPEDYVDVTGMVKLNMAPAPILWCYEGMYHLVPMEHVADVMDAVRRHLQLNKNGTVHPNISMGEAVPIDYDVGLTLSRRPCGKKLDGN